MRTTSYRHQPLSINHRALCSEPEKVSDLRVIRRPESK